MTATKAISAAYGTVSITESGIEANLPPEVELQESPENIVLTIKPKSHARIMLAYSKPCSMTMYIGEDAVADVFEHIEADGELSSKIILHQNARLSLAEFFDVATAATVSRTIDVQENAHLSRAMLLGKANNLKIKTDIHLKSDAQCKDNEVLFLHKKESAEVKTNIHHMSGRSTAKVLIKGVVVDAASAFTYGTLHIAKAAKNSETSLQEHILLLSKDAKANAIPSLEIEADDVLAKHAASVTHLNQDQLFYLASRALPESEAKKLIIKGFLASALTAMENSQMQEAFEKSFEEKWQQLSAQ